MQLDIWSEVIYIFTFISIINNDYIINCLNPKWSTDLKTNFLKYQNYLTLVGLPGYSYNDLLSPTAPITYGSLSVIM